MGKAGYVGQQPTRQAQFESYPGAWASQEQLGEAKALTWPRTGFNVERSLRFNDDDLAYLSRSFGSTGTTTTWTYSGWVKRSSIGTTQVLFGVRDSGTPGLRYTLISLIGEQLYFYNYWGASNPYIYGSPIYRDLAAWYHFVVVYDSNNATAADRMRLYVNGQRLTNTVGLAPSLGQPSYIISPSSATDVFIGRDPTAANASYFDGYLANVHFIDGQALDPSYFGYTNEATGEWLPKRYTNPAGYGTNGFWLTFGDNSGATSSTLGKDYSGNGNNFTPSGFDVIGANTSDSFIDVPTSYGVDNGVGGNVGGNYCTFNNMEPYQRNYVTLSNGGLWVRSTQAYSSPGGTIGTPSTGKWYWEASVISVTAGTNFVIGFKTAGAKAFDYPGYQATSWAYRSSGNKQNNGEGSSPATVYGTTWTSGDVIGVAIDADAGTATFYKNGVSQGIAYSGLSGSFTPHMGVLTSTDNAIFALNAGQRPWAYAPPAGHKALCSTNLPEPSIVKPNTAMDVKLFTGNSGTQTISGLAFSPDLVWVKNRTTGEDHNLQDTARGAGNNRLRTPDNGGENTQAGQISSFNSDGWTMGDRFNVLSNNYVAWTWEAGSETVTNTNGSITSQVRVNQNTGCSILTYAGTGGAATVGHGLGRAPQMIIIKRRDAVGDWFVGHSSLGWTKYFEGLNTSLGAKTGLAWNDTAPTSSLFSIGPLAPVNAGVGTYVAYCFAQIEGYSSFGIYTGDTSLGSLDYPFIYTGFRPKWIMIKAVTNVAGGSWNILDTSRAGYNGDNKSLFANTTATDGTDNPLDIVSNGFKIRNATANVGTTAEQYVYVAFAESPFKYARAR